MTAAFIPIAARDTATLMPIILRTGRVVLDVTGVVGAWNMVVLDGS